MKKNICDILENTNDHQIEMLTNDIEYEVPNDISIKNIESMVFSKTGVTNKKKKFSRNVFIRYGAIAACFALLLCAYPTIKHLSTGGQEIIKVTDNNSALGAITGPATDTENAIEIATENIMTYKFFFPNEDGTISYDTFTEYLDEGKSSLTMNDYIQIFFKYCYIKNVSLISSKVDDISVTEYKEYDGETVISYTPSRILTLTLEGSTELSENVKKCLINTLDGISYCEYFKVIYNGEYISIDGETPENGFTKFELDVVDPDEETTSSAVPGGIITGGTSTNDTAPTYPSSSTEALPPYNPSNIPFETSAPYIPN
jgi:hypothetical protein